MNVRTTLILVLVLLAGAAGAGVLWLVGGTTTPGDGEALKPLITKPLRVERVEAVTLERRAGVEGGRLRFERRAGGWRQVQPVVFPAKAAGVEALVQAAREARVVRAAEGDEVTGLASTPNLGDGSEPWPAVLRIAAAEGPITLRLGRATSAERGYVELDGRVWLVEGSLHRAVAGFDVAAYRADQLGVPVPGAVARLRMTIGDEAVEVERGMVGEDWRVVTPGEGPLVPAMRADAAEINQVLTTLRAVRATQFISGKTAREDAVGTRRPTARVDVWSGEPEARQTLRLGRPTLDGGEVAASWEVAAADAGVNSPGEPALFLVSRAVVEPLLMSPQDLIDRRPFALVSADVREVRIEGAEQSEPVVVSRRAGGYGFGEPGPGYGLDADAASVLVKALTSLQVNRVERWKPTDSNPWASGEGAVAVELWPLGVGASERVEVVEADDGGLLFVRRDEGLAYRFDPEGDAIRAARELVRTLREAPRSLRDRVVWSAANVADVTRIERRRAGLADDELVRDERGAWSLAGDRPIDDEAVRGVQRALMPLRAVRWLAPQDVDADAEPLAEVTLTLGDRERPGDAQGEVAEPPRVTLRLWSRDAQTGRAVTSVSGVDAPFELEAVDAEALLGPWRDAVALPVAVTGISRLERTGGDDDVKTVTILRDADGTLSVPGVERFDQRAAAAVLDAAAGLRAAAFLPEDHAMAGEPTARVMITARDGRAFELALWRDGTGRWIGRVGEVWFVVDEAAVRGILRTVAVE